MLLVLLAAAGWDVLVQQATMGMSGSDLTMGVGPALFLALYLFSAVGSLTAYRVLMVWVYDPTESLLVAWLMHASYAACTMFIFAIPVIGASYLTNVVVFTAVLWAVVAAVAVANRGQLARPPLYREMGAASR